MSATTLNTEQLMRELDTLKPDFFPLQAHALQEVDLHTKEMYATVLAAVLLVDGKVSATEHRLFGMLLTSLGLEGIQARLFEQACALDSAQLHEFLRVIKDAEAESCFVLDALVLCRVEGQLTHLQTQLLSELLEFLQLPEHELAALIFWVSKILRLPIEIDVPQAGQEQLLITKNRTEDIETYNVGKILISKGDYVAKGQELVTVKNRPTHWVHGVRISVAGKEDDSPKIKSLQNGIIYNISIKQNEEIRIGQVIATIIPFSSATNAWLEFI